MKTKSNNVVPKWKLVLDIINMYILNFVVIVETTAYLWFIALSILLPKTQAQCGILIIATIITIVCIWLYYKTIIKEAGNRCQTAFGAYYKTLERKEIIRIYRVNSKGTTAVNVAWGAIIGASTLFSIYKEIAGSTAESMLTYFAIAVLITLIVFLVMKLSNRIETYKVIALEEVIREREISKEEIFLI